MGWTWERDGANPFNCFCVRNMDAVTDTDFDSGTVNPACPPESTCCAKKTVGGVEYSLLDDKTDTSSFGCKSNCVYEKDVGGGRFCFAKGDMEVACGDGFPGNCTSVPLLSDCILEVNNCDFLFSPVANPPLCKCECEFWIPEYDETDETVTLPPGCIVTGLKYNLKGSNVLKRTPNIPTPSKCGNLCDKLSFADGWTWAKAGKEQDTCWCVKSLVPSTINADFDSGTKVNCVKGR